MTGMTISPSVPSSSYLKYLLRITYILFQLLSFTTPSLVFPFKFFGGTYLVPSKDIKASEPLSSVFVFGLHFSSEIKVLVL